MEWIVTKEVPPWRLVVGLLVGWAPTDDLECPYLNWKSNTSSSSLTDTQAVTSIASSIRLPPLVLIIIATEFHYENLLKLNN